MLEGLVDNHRVRGNCYLPKSLQTDGRSLTLAQSGQNIIPRQPRYGEMMPMLMLACICEVLQFTPRSQPSRIRSPCVQWVSGAVMLPAPVSHACLWGESIIMFKNFTSKYGKKKPSTF